MELLILVITTIIVAGVTAAYYVYKQMTYWKDKGTLYSSPVPIFGHLAPIFFQRQSFPEFVSEAYKRFGDAKYYGMMNFNAPTIFIKDPDLIKDICIKNFDFCPNHESFVDERLDPIMSKNVFSLCDDRWREIRGRLTPSFTASKMKFMFQLVSNCSENFVQYFIDNPEATKMVDMKDAFTRYTNDVIATAAFGISVDSLKNRNNEFYLHGKDASSFKGIFRALKFILAGLCPRVLKFFGVKFLSHKADKFFNDLVTETVRTREKNGIVRPDMIHLLMEAKNNDTRINMTIEDIIAQALIFFLAGFDTSSSLMCFISHMLAFHQDVQEKLQDEIDSIVEKNDGVIDYNLLSEMKYMDMVINETLRLYPPSTITDRVCVRKFKLPPAQEGCEEVLVNPGNCLWIPIYGLHHDEKYFEDPEKFNPERFSDENKSKINPYAFIPFGLGPRKCIGERFALMETKIIIVNLLRKFTIKPTDKMTEKIEFEKQNFNIECKGGTWLNLQLRTKDESSK